ncbi:Hypothetical protein, putative [Bodo saltans]|uniref:Uncharacterized protein n=1 Tax=Bodo saltans TaxID=75058 RepID=A0A0S4J247_BODSA|nr:Hypothetical protein, putative [Bodo saltans]|eukprot:CUG38621.1 Hypothetical protein, putative [Bodo saltans]
MRVASLHARYRRVSCYFLAFPPNDSLSLSWHTRQFWPSSSNKIACNEKRRLLNFLEVSFFADKPASPSNLFEFLAACWAPQETSRYLRLLVETHEKQKKETLPSLN